MNIMRMDKKWSNGLKKIKYQPYSTVYFILPKMPVF